MRKTKSFLLLLPLLASACAAGPAYKRPLLPQAAAGPFVTQAAGTDPTEALPDQWWRLYRDPALDALIERAFAANTDLRVASANLDKAYAVLREARGGRLPSTDLSGGVSYGDAVQGGPGQAGFSTGGGAQWSGNAGLSIAWEADLFGRVRRSIEAARADAQAVEAARDAVRVTVAAETARAYADACSYAFSLRIARESLKTGEENLRLVTAQERAGSAGQFDVERAGVTLAATRATIPPLEAQRQVALYELAALLGATPSEVPEAALRCEKPPEPVTAALPVGDGAALLRRRPDLREAERQLAADTARIGVATADLYPRISLGGSGNFFRNDQVKGSDSFSFSLGPLLSWSFPNMAIARARLRQAEAQGAASLATFDGKVVTALKETEQALATYQAEQRRLDALRDAQERAERAYRLADLRYRAGSASYLDLLVSQRDLLDARANFASSSQRLASARIDLFKALGGGWQAAAPAS